MANIQALFDAVVDAALEHKKVKVPVINRSEHETIRTRLVTLWNQHKEAILAIGGDDSDPLYPLSLCATHHQGSGSDDGETQSYSEYWLGKPRRKMAKNYSFTIVEADETPSATLGEAVNEPIIHSVKLPTS